VTQSGEVATLNGPSRLRPSAVAEQGPQHGAAGAPSAALDSVPNALSCRIQRAFESQLGSLIDVRNGCQAVFRCSRQRSD
jgi:hypothetical protein